MLLYSCGNLDFLNLNQLNPPSFGAKQSDFRFHILYQCTIRTNSRSAPVGKHSDETAPTLLERRFAEIAPHHTIHLNVTSQFCADVTSTFNLTHVSQPRIFECAMENEDASTAVPESTVFMTTNGSFQNQPPVATPRGRKRAISALLKGITNHCPGDLLCEPKEPWRARVSVVLLVGILYKEASADRVLQSLQVHPHLSWK